MPVPALIDLTESAMVTALKGFLGAVVPGKLPIILGQTNRVAEPIGDFIRMTPIRRERLSTNIDAWADIVLIGSIANATLTVTDITGGALVVGNPLTGAGLVQDTAITGFLTGTGATGTYTIAPGGQTITDQALYAGVKWMRQPTEMVIQLDVHGPASGDNAQIIATLMRDETAILAIEDTGIANFTPLYTSDPRQVPFINAEQQYEWRWVIDASFEAQITVTLMQQFADQLAVGLTPVDLVYPA